jgi:hypothetical protein
MFPLMEYLSERTIKPGCSRQSMAARTALEKAMLRRDPWSMTEKALSGSIALDSVIR